MSKVFCPNCGTENEGVAGGRVVCRACTATFDVPGGSQYEAPPPAVQTVAPKRPVGQQDYAPAPVVVPSTSASAPMNTLAIVSLVSSLLCCTPVGLVTGIIGLQQINGSNGRQKGKELAIIGIVISALGMCSGVLYTLALVLAGR